MIARPQVWVAELAARFWAAVGDPPPFPRDLRSVLCWLPNLHVIAVPRLTLTSAAEHFARHNIPCAAPAEDRPLTGCFGAYRGVGVILADPTLDPAELRFTMAHEVAHFLRDYDKPRRRAATWLEPRALEALDGFRPPTVNERLAGVLRGVTVGPHTHFLDRDRWGRAATPDTKEAEEAADRLAYELLAPFDEVNPGAATRRDALVSRLTSEFGLPPREAAKYAVMLLR
jgi:hypothetical protein